MRYKKNHLLLIGLFQLFMPCNRPKRTVLYKAACNSKNLELHLITRETWQTTYHHHELWFDGKSAGTINYETLGQTLPYYPEVYGTAPWHYLDTTEQYYSIMKSGPLRKLRVMLYINPEEWSLAQFKELYICMQQQHKALQQVIENNQAFQRYQFGGIVYGNEESFVQRYEKSKNQYFEVHPDGSIEHHLLESDGGTITSIDGFNSKIIMPGKYIVIENPLKYTIDKLHEYRHVKTNRPIDTDFTVKYK